MKALCIIFLEILFASLSLRATQNTIVYTNEDSGILIELESWLDVHPIVGMTPIKWKVTNLSDKDGNWRIEFNSINGYMGQSFTNSSFSMHVQSGQNAEMTMYVPMGNGKMQSYYYRNLNCQVYGPGTNSNSIFLHSGSSSSSTQFVAVGSSAAGNGGWNALEQQVKNKHGRSELFGSVAEMQMAPEDWRGYSGISQLWISESEWLEMSELRRIALTDWLSMGGEVYLMIINDNSDHLMSLKLPGTQVNDDTFQYGTGRLRTVKWDGKQFPVDYAAQKIAAQSKSLEKRIGIYNNKLDLVKNVGTLEINGVLVFSFITLFGLLVGPVNLFWLTKAKRSRLFWTTPAISIAGSLKLMILMIVQDGFGGSGTRMVTMVLQPDAKRVSIMQEQISKTGVLLNNQFNKHEPLLFLPFETASNSERYIKGKYYDNESHASGDWFSSRAIQGQWLQTVRPSRAKVEFFPALDESGEPEVISSLGITLKEIWVRDESGNLWRGTDLGTGERKKLKKVNDIGEHKKFIQDHVIGIKGPLLKDAIEEVVDLKGYVVGISDDVGDVAIKTLESIDWKKQQLTVIGPYELKK